MKTKEEITKMYLDATDTLYRYAKEPELVANNYKFYLEMIIEYRVLKRILEIED